MQSQARRIAFFGDVDNSARLDAFAVARLRDSVERVALR